MDALDKSLVILIRCGQSHLIYGLCIYNAICECLVNRFDRRLNNGYYCLLCCDWLWCQCIGILNTHVIGPQLVDYLARKPSIDICMVYKPRHEWIGNHHAQFIKLKQESFSNTVWSLN